MHPPGAGKFTSLRVFCKKLDDITFEMASKKQKDEYIQAIGKGVVCHTVGGPIVGESKFKRLGYDAVWEIVPGLLNENEIRFSYKHKVCDLSDNNDRRVPGHESLTPYPAFGNCPLRFRKIHRNGRFWQLLVRASKTRKR